MTAKFPLPSEAKEKMRQEWMADWTLLGADPTPTGHGFELFELKRLLHLKHDSPDRINTSTGIGTSSASTKSHTNAHSGLASNSNAANNAQSSLPAKQSGAANSESAQSASAGSNAHATNSAPTAGLGIDTRPVLFNLVVHGGYEGSEFFVAYLSNDVILIRYSGVVGVPIIRYVRWFKDPALQIKAMAFNPIGQWLVCVTHNLTVFLIPLFFIVSSLSAATSPSASSLTTTGLGLSALGDLNEASESEGSQRDFFSGSGSAKQQAEPESSSWFSDFFGFNKNKEKEAKKENKDPGPARVRSGELGSLDDLTMITSAARASFYEVTCCCWWKSWGLAGTSSDYVIVGSASGNIRIIDLFTHQVLRLRCKFPIKDMFIVEGETSLKFLIISTTEGGCFQLLLETAVSVRNAETNQVTTQFESIFKNHEADAYQMKHLSVFSTKSSEVNLSLQHHKGSQFIGSFKKGSVEIYDFHLRRDYPIYTYHIPAENTQFFHLSNEIMFVGANLSNIHAQVQVVSRLLAAQQIVSSSTCMQSILLPKGQQIRGYYGKMPTTHDEQTDGNGTTPLTGLYIWTQDSLYELVPATPPEKLFFQLLTHNQGPEAEELGKTFHLDLYSLYEMIADEYFKNKEYGRALDLYFLSNINASKFISCYLQIGRMDVVITRLRTLLSNPDALANADRVFLSGVLLKCYVSKALKASTVEPVIRQQPQSKPNSPTSASTVSNNSSHVHTHGNVDMIVYSGANATTNSNTAASNPYSSAAPTTASVDDGFVVDSEFEQFLKNNFYYDAHQALQLCSDAQLMYYYFVVAIARNMIEEALKMITILKSSLYLTDRILNNLKENYLLEQLKQCADGMFINFLHPREQIMLFLSDPYAIAKYFAQIRLLLPHLDENTLAYVASQFDPLGQTMSHLFTFVGRGSKIVSFINKSKIEDNTGEPAPERDKYVEMYLTALLTLQHKRKQRTDAETGDDGSHVPLHAENRKKESKEKEYSRKVVKKVAVGWNHTLILTDKSEVFVWGRNHTGQLGTGNREDVLSPMLLSFATHMGITHIAAGGEHSIICDGEGNVYSFGSSRKGQLGHGDAKTELYPKKIKTFNLGGGNAHANASGVNTPNKSPVVSSSLHGSSGSAVTSALASPLTGSLSPSPTTSRIAKVCCGFQVTLVLLENSDVYIWGDAYLGNDQPVYVPTKLQHNLAMNDSKWVDIACGYSHIVLLSSNGEVYTFGHGRYGQLGLGDQNDQYQPRLVTELSGKHIMSISSGPYCTVAITDLKNVYFWGDNCGDKSQSSSMGSAPTSAASSTGAGQSYANSPMSSHVSPIAFASTSVTNNNIAASSTSAILTGASVTATNSSSASSFAPVLLPTRIESLRGKAVASVSCGSSYFIVTTEKGEVYQYQFDQFVVSPDSATANSLPNSGSHTGVGQLSGSSLLLGALSGSASNSNQPATSFHERMGVMMATSRALQRNRRKSIGPNSESDDFPIPSFSDIFGGSATPSPQSSGSNGGSNANSSSTLTASNLPSSPLQAYQERSAGQLPNQPQLLGALSERAIKCVQCGQDFFVALSANGSMYSWGIGRYGQLGQGNVATVAKPEYIDLDFAYFNKKKAPFGFTDSLDSSNGDEEDDSLQIYYKHTTLLKALCVQFGNYRPQTIISQCRRFQNWSCEATVYELMEQWSSAIDARLMQVTARLPRPLPKPAESSSDSTASESTGVTELVLDEHNEDVLLSLLTYTYNLLKSQEHEIPNKDQLLYKVLDFWKKKALPAVFLSQFILTKIKVFAPVLATILEKCVSEEPEKRAPLCFEFDTQVYLYITKYYLEAIQNTGGDAENRVSEQNMFRNIKENLGKNLERMQHVVLTPSEIAKYSAAKVESIFVFSCGHHYSILDFENRVLSHFTTKVSSLPNPIPPITLKFILAEYHENETSMACPMCLYNDLRVQHGKDGQMGEKWEYY